MTDLNDSASLTVSAKYWTEDEASKARKKSKRALRAERQLGLGPPWTRDGRTILYPIAGHFEWLKAGERRAVRGAASTASTVAKSAPVNDRRKRDRERVADPVDAH